MTLDVKVQGQNTAAGHLEVSGISFDFIEVGGKLYLRGRSLFAKYAPQAADVIGDRWVNTNPDNPNFQDAISGIGNFTDPSGLADSLGSSSGAVTKAGNVTVNGQNAVVLKNSDGTLDVADSSPAYPLRLDAGSHGSMTLSGFGSDFKITAPSDAIDATGASSSDSGSSTDTSTDSSTDTGSASDTGSGTDSGTDTSTDTSSDSSST
jgi:hypothetical protein